MFLKGTIKDTGIDITIKNNPDHILAPNDWNMVYKVKFNKISVIEYRYWYLNLIKDRWEHRKSEFIELARTGLDKDVKLKCFCANTSDRCHAHFASEFMNILVNKINKV